MNDEKQQQFAAWLQGRPSIIRDLAAKYPPDCLYVLETTQQVVQLYSYCEDGTVTVSVLREFNADVITERNVFGIDPADLSPKEQTA